ncbi:MAG: TIGR00270 family protein [Candidatus Aenigmarchaeota archaeon]|nr:TIGR00270 family protein [Candidatus Aenigmarchaeota archaeon]MBU5688692.1 TIGR00270 family protein [Candidatus Aenigmarchaeota archaeon]
MKGVFIPECTICGKDEKDLVKIKVEDAIVEVCKNCSSFGQIVLEKKKEEVKEEKIKEEEYDLIDNFGEIIKKAREKNNLSRKDFASKIRIKENILRRIESEELIPEVEIAKKIEKQLGIKILQKIDSTFTKKDYKKAELTIGDVAKID